MSFIIDLFSILIYFTLYQRLANSATQTYNEFSHFAVVRWYFKYPRGFSNTGLRLVNAVDATVATV